MMTRRRTVLTAAASAALAATITLTGCTADQQPTAVSTPAASSVISQSVVLAATDESLADQLRYLIEEEKLAHDVYVTLGDQWGSRIFSNIASAEVRHQRQVEALLPTYGFDDPRIDQVGRFADPDLQALYDRLVAEGSRSQAAAFQVGVTIEETDIADLKAAMSGAPADVTAVLESLLSGSQNHLAAFQRQLA